MVQGWNCKFKENRIFLMKIDVDIQECLDHNMINNYEDVKTIC